MNTELTAIHADTDDRYEFSLLVAGYLPVRVVVSTSGNAYGAHAVVETGERFPAEDAHLYNGNMRELPSPAVASAAVSKDKAAFRVRRILKTLASDVERFIQALPAERIVELAARFVPVEAAEQEARGAEAVDQGVLPPYEGPTEQELEAEAELDAHAERAFAEDLERRAAQGTWWGTGPDTDDVPF